MRGNGGEIISSIPSLPKKDFITILFVRGNISESGFQINTKFDTSRSSPLGTVRQLGFGGTYERDKENLFNGIARFDTLLLIGLCESAGVSV
jgi:hypothetical protein